MPIPPVLDFAHALAARAVEPGGLAIDATVGNGHDTLFLARQVGDTGRVLGFDVQEEAIEQTRRRLESEGVEASVHLIHEGHETMKNHLETSHQGDVQAVMFNLGYLPGGDHSVITRPKTTLQALEDSSTILRPGGVITIVVYSGHEGGAEEAEAVRKWASALPQHTFTALSYGYINHGNDPPQLIAVEKTGRESQEHA